MMMNDNNRTKVIAKDIFVSSSHRSNAYIVYINPFGLVLNDNNSDKRRNDDGILFILYGLNIYPYLIINYLRLRCSLRNTFNIGFKNNVLMHIMLNDTNIKYIH
ncbi:hypothetical protein DERP_013622 [Dermatophagoides pteronyssinus]|uniref:Uncharacterized protein n=1 Tax=Dermatophagoides pteronyssinus TaxID=6956 RepID=A0ABQ8IPW1_DERPT|nr:hypothetical protein DERP_013622 [Dermatophagoides pteronyssinus]